VYRTIQRFYEEKNIDWKKINLQLFKKFQYKKDDVFLLAADETVEKKSGKQTFGLSYFFSNIFKQPISSVAIMAMSLVSINQRKSFPIAIKQIVKEAKNAKEKDVSKKTKIKNDNLKIEDETKLTEDNNLKTKRQKGRPKGSKNKPKEESKDIQYKVLEELLKNVTISLFSIFGHLPVSFLVLDGYFGNQFYVRLALKYKVHLISKLKSTASLYFQYDEIYSGKGRHKKYGKKLNKNSIPSKFLKKTTVEKKYKYEIYQLELWNKKINDFKLNVVVIKAIQLSTNQIIYCNLFTTDLTLSYDKIVDYYSLRFQIEFNFRDAKQFFGLADFKNYKETQVTNAINISFYMCNFAYILIGQLKEKFNIEIASILDLKAYLRAEKIGNEALKLKKQAKNKLDYLSPTEIFELAKFQSVNF